MGFEKKTRTRKKTKIRAKWEMGKRKKKIIRNRRQETSRLSLTVSNMHLHQIAINLATRLGTHMLWKRLSGEVGSENKYVLAMEIVKVRAYAVWFTGYRSAVQSGNSTLVNLVLVN